MNLQEFTQLFELMNQVNLSKKLRNLSGKEKPVSLNQYPAQNIPISRRFFFLQILSSFRVLYKIA